MNILSFLLTVFNNKLKEKNAFENADIMIDEIDKYSKLLAENEDISNRLIREYKSYIKYRNSHKIFAQQGE